MKPSTSLPLYPTPVRIGALVKVAHAVLFSLFVGLAVPAEGRPVRVCIVGDSITAGFSPATRGWGVPLQALNAGGADWGVKNIAYSGDKVAQARIRFDSDIPGRVCTWVLFLIGTNDLPDGTAAATIYTGIAAMAVAAETGGSRVMLLSVLPRATGASFTAALETRRVALNVLLAARAGSTYADTSTALTGTAVGTAWASSTAYSLDVVRVNGGKAYVVTTAGTSAGSGGPTGTGTSITDGSVVWRYAPALGSEYGGATDGLHPNNTGGATIAATVQTAALAAGGW